MLSQYVTASLERNKFVFEALLSGLTPEVYLWKAEPEKWCLLEIVCHLYDEEREDFRARTRYALENAGNAIPSIDPVSWVTDRRYTEQHYPEVLNNFLTEREASLAWLQSLEDPKWEYTCHHPALGDVSAAHFLANWLAHDYHHIRQINNLKYEYLEHHAGESLAYAGNW